jgi:hypothetical protein
LNIFLIILFYHRKTNVKYTNVPTRPSSDEDDVEMRTVVPGAIVMAPSDAEDDEWSGVPRPAAFSSDILSTTASYVKGVSSMDSGLVVAALAIPLEAVEVRSECDENARMAVGLSRLDALLRTGMISNEEYWKARQDAIGLYTWR